jgi:hypothetical protein
MYPPLAFIRAEREERQRAQRERQPQSRSQQRQAQSNNQAGQEPLSEESLRGSSLCGNGVYDASSGHRDGELAVYDNGRPSSADAMTLASPDGAYPPVRSEGYDDDGSDVDNPEHELSIQVPQSFCVRDELTANWVVRKIKEARAYAEHVEAWAAAEMERARREEEFFMMTFGGQLEQFATAQLLKQKSRRKSLPLPAGTLAFRSQPERMTVQDEAALLQWAKLHRPEAVRIEVAVDATVEKQLRQWLNRYAPDVIEDERKMRNRVSRRVVNEHFQLTGELPGGCAVEPEHEKFCVK